MAQFVFKGGYPRYYPTLALFTKPGEVHPLDSAPDADWAEVTDTAATAVAPAVTPVAPTPAPTPAEVADDALKAAEALLEANPELAAKIVEDAKNA